MCRPENSVSFLNQLKSQASALQVQQRSQAQSFDANVAQTESACLKTWHDLSDLARQVNRKNTLLAAEFDYMTGSRGSVKISADHEAATLSFRVANASRFDILHAG